MAMCVSWHLHLRAAQVQRPHISFLPWEALSDCRKCLFGDHLATTEHQHPSEVTQFEETAPASGLLAHPPWHRLQNSNSHHTFKPSERHQ